MAAKRFNDSKAAENTLSKEELEKSFGPELYVESSQEWGDWKDKKPESQAGPMMPADTRWAQAKPETQWDTKHQLEPKEQRRPVNSQWEYREPEKHWNQAEERWENKKQEVKQVGPWETKKKGWEEKEASEEDQKDMWDIEETGAEDYDDTEEEDDYQEYPEQFEEEEPVDRERDPGRFRADERCGAFFTVT